MNILLFGASMMSSVTLLGACSESVEQEPMAKGSDSYLNGFSDPVEYGLTVQKANSGDTRTLNDLITYYAYTRPLDHRNLEYWAQVAFEKGGAPEKGDNFGWLHLAHAELISPYYGCASAMKTIKKYEAISKERDPKEYEERTPMLNFIVEKCSAD